jgi:hypothetical protein
MITRTLRVALNGADAGLLHVEQDRSEVPLVLQARSHSALAFGEIAT